MKITKRITAAIAAMSILMTLTACGNESANTDSIETVVNVNDIETTASIAETDAPVTTESIIETEAVTEADPYAYLELINADYQSYYNTMVHEACIVDGIAYFYAVAANPNDWGNLNDYKGYYSYNIATGETKCIVPYEKKMESACYAGGQIYTIVGTEVRCYDLDGNILKTFNNTADLRWDNDFEIQAVMADGSCVVGYNNFKYHYLISSDFTSAQLIAETTEGAHGTTEETPYAFVIGGRGNILYVAESSMKKVFYGIDVTTGEKTEYAIPENAPGMGAEWVNLFGNEYYKTQDNGGTAIMKISTGEVVTTLDGLADEYYGGEYFFKKGSSAIASYKYQAENGEVDSNVLFKLEDGKAEFTVLNGEYYLVTDEYGTFLRNINSDEEIQITFE